MAPPDKIGSITYKDLESILEHWKCEDCGIDPFVGKEKKKMYMSSCGHYLCKDCLAKQKKLSEVKPVLMCSRKECGDYNVNWRVDGNNDPPAADHINDFVDEFRKNGYLCDPKRQLKLKIEHNCPIDMMRCALGSKNPLYPQDFLCALCMNQLDGLQVRSGDKWPAMLSDPQWAARSDIIDEKMLKSRKPWHMSILNGEQMRAFITRLLICVECKAEFGKSGKLARLPCGTHVVENCDTCEKTSKKETDTCEVCKVLPNGQAIKHEMPTGLHRKLRCVPMDFQTMCKINFKDYIPCDKCGLYHPPTHFPKFWDTKCCFFCFVDPGN